MADFFVHSTAIVDSEQIGAGTRIWAFSHVLKGAVIGEQCNIGDHCFIEGGAIIGSRVTMKNSNMVWEGVTIADGAFIGPHVFFTNDLYPRSPRLQEAAHRYENHGWLSETHIGYGASLGAAAVILAGITVGEFATIGAGAVISKDVAAHALMVGNPARQIGWVCRCGLRLDIRQDQITKCHCGDEYSLAEEGLHRISAK
jgi:acetyltransferase-like isoleucine patch superfamily enzyme